MATGSGEIKAGEADGKGAVAGGCGRGKGMRWACRRLR